MLPLSVLMDYGISGHRGFLSVLVVIMLGFRVKIERRPGAPPFWSTDALGTAVVVILLTAMVAFTVLVVGFYIAGYR